MYQGSPTVAPVLPPYLVGPASPCRSLGQNHRADLNQGIDRTDAYKIQINVNRKSEHMSPQRDLFLSETQNLGRK